MSAPEATLRFRAPVPAATRRAAALSGMGSFPAISLSTGVGLVLCSLANALSRSTVANSHLLYYAGLMVIAVPIFYRLSSRSEPRTGERLALVCLLGLALYAVKVIREPGLFTIPDEFLHAYNADLIGIHDHLFQPNPILPVSAYYPGLEGATAGLMDLTGMSSFAAGTIVVGAARLVLCIGLFLLFVRISASPWIAGIGAAMYAGNPNFLILGAQYSYQSLALPLLVVVLWTVAEREMAPPPWMRAWAVPAVVLTAAVVVTHHVTSYGLAAGLAAIGVAYLILGRGWRAPNPLPFAALTVALAGLWLLVVSSTALGYLGKIFSTAWETAIDTISGGTTFREPFESSVDTTIGTPTGARLVAVLSILALFALVPIGVREVLRRRRSNAFALVFCLMAVAFFAALALRFASASGSSAAWEIGDRASEFLYIGLAFVVALSLTAVYEWVVARRGKRLGRTLLTLVFSLVIAGGAISAWPWDAQLAQPIRAKVGGRTIESESLGLAEWARERLPGEKFMGPVADAYLLLAPGEVRALGASYKVQGFLRDPIISDDQARFLRRRKVRYVVTDRRRTTEDYVRGFFFEVRPQAPKGERLLPRGPTRKYKRLPTAARVFDSGDIVVFDLEARR